MTDTDTVERIADLIEGAVCSVTGQIDFHETAKAIAALPPAVPVNLLGRTFAIEYNILGSGKTIDETEQNASASGSASPDPVSEAAKVILGNRYGGYGNRKAMQAMWNFVYEQHGRHMLPMSHYDGVFQAGLRALIKDGEDG